jgi:hypothetical protein
MVLHLVFKILLIIAVDIEVFLLKDEETVAELTGLEIYKPLRIKGKAIIPGLEMEMRTCRTS